MRQDREQVGGGKQEGKLHWQRAGRLEMQLQVQENGTLQGTEPRKVTTLSSAHRQNMFLLPPHRVLALVDPTPSVSGMSTYPFASARARVLRVCQRCHAVVSSIEKRNATTRAEKMARVPCSRTMATRRVM